MTEGSLMAGPASQGRNGGASGSGEGRLENLLYAIQLGQGIGSLRFVPALETEFQNEYAQRNLGRMRTGFMLAIGLYLAFLIVRVLFESGPAAAWGLALRMVIIGTMLVAVLASYTLSHARLRPLIVFTYLVYGGGVTAIECVAEYFGTDRRYEGLIFIAIHCYVFSGLLFRWACATNVVIFAIYAVGGWFGGLHGAQWGYELFFMLLINVLGATALYLLEYSDRENFLRRHIIREMAIRDGLTGLFNRTAFVEHMERVLRQAVREQQPLMLLIFDLDYFKQYNDQYGHLAGDECLRSVAAALGIVTRRPLDMLARYGGEEFSGIWYGSPPGSALGLAESIRATVSGLAIPHARSPLKHVTVSVGVVSVTPHPGETVTSLMKLADDALYEAKAAGRNKTIARIEQSTPDGVPVPA